MRSAIARAHIFKDFTIPAGADCVKVQAEVAVNSPMMAFLITETDGRPAPRKVSEWPVLEPGEYHRVEFTGVVAARARGRFVLLPVFDVPEQNLWANFRLLVADPEVAA